MSDTPHDDAHVPTRGSRLHQIHEDDLATLERLLPEVTGLLWPTMTPRLKVQLRTIQTILSNVRWNYGPPIECHTFPADGPLPSA
jgi:hypothetical protein